MAVAMEGVLREALVGLALESRVQAQNAGA
jgi:hypothetical protein